MATLGDGTSWAHLAGPGHLHTAVEEVRDVRVLLGLGHVVLRPAGLAEGLGGDRALLGAEGDQDGQARLVFAQGDDEEVLGRRASGGAGAVERIERGLGQRVRERRARSARKFTWTIGSRSRSAPPAPSITVGTTNSSVSSRA